MYSVIEFELIRERERLDNELNQLQEEIDILNLLFLRLRKEYEEVNRQLVRNQSSISQTAVNEI